ncbi:MAG: hypothetical protein IRZ16_17870 [Myxococcaceae bacterium]|nr:hypothetical protein [Myxococcaceae bacterium]
MSAPKKAEAPTQQTEPMYPVIEAWVERASADDVGAFFAPVKAELDGLKGPRAEQAKKAKAAIARTEELLSHLLQVREKLEAEKKAGGAGRK